MFYFLLSRTGLNHALEIVTRRQCWLAGAFTFQVTASLALQAAVETPGRYAIALLGYLSASVCLPRVLKSCMAIGVDYGIWGASGVALTAVMAAVLFG